MEKKFALLAAFVAIGASWPLMSQQQVPVAPLAPPTTAQIEQATGPDVAAATSRTLEAKDLETWLDGYIPASLEQGKIAGAVISVVKDGQPILIKGYGDADIASEKPMDGHRSLVRIGSTSKLFTWTAVMQLVEQGKIDLDRDVNAYLDFKIPHRDGRPVTMNDLMTHRGGFEEGLKEVLVKDASKNISNEQYLKEHPRPRIFPAGQVPAYSNYGTSLAGYIVARVSGESFDDYVERHILTPLRMTNTTFRQPLPDRLKPQMSSGYTSASEDPYGFEFITTAPAGSVSATAADMANFMIAHLQHGQFGGSRILKPETARFMHSPSLDNGAGFDTMAHGFFHGERNGRVVIGHGGDTVVFHTDMNLIPAENVGFFMSFNSRGEGGSVYGVRERLFTDFMDRYFPAPAAKDPPAIATAKAHAQEAAGGYESSRRVESGFIGMFYVLQQQQVIANEDGTISLGSSPQEKYREIAPYVWREIGGTHQLKLTQVAGRKTLIDSRDPTSVMQAVPAGRSANMNLFILLGSVAVLLWILLAWPIGWRFRRAYNVAHPLSGRPLLAHRLTRFAALGDFVYLGGWIMLLLPLTRTDLAFYGPSLDPVLRLLQIGAILPIGAAAVGLWNAWLTVKSDRKVGAKIGSIVIAAAFLGILWISWLGNLISFNVNY
ncbi:serine hydrolase domain-containing protein [Sphingosinicella rhizophila]|uniref:Serine hydrolase domain-containing protein n=1 Tax=Sphingosinicella rhizophila TaxID=3050082 RepID=A0ABU3QA50_9SPHN|nr:serine hydrolase domain-containing protein [Sphingosinicella sp. GR2756]MDT9600290.1 serine hydrolase domain-containing protein [Sphingosinicella sp. GR2756]